MQDWSIEYEIVDRTVNPKEAFRRTATFKNLRWKRDPAHRDVLVFGVSRTVPANERVELARCASGSFHVPAERIEDFSPTVRDAVTRILGKNVTGFKRLKVQDDGRIVLLTGVTSGGVGYSEFHFGAGESSIIRMVTEIELAREQALVLIEEIENGLHPVATVRMVEYLIEAAERKKIQALFTTHSNDALRALPAKAIWVATRDRIFQGKLDIQSLRAITGEITSALVIFVEDEFAKTWLEAILRQQDDIGLEHIQVHGMEGDGIAVAVNKHHNINPAIQVQSLCFIDGDSKQNESEKDRVFRLPGESPEAFVFDEVLASWPVMGGKLALALHLKYEATERVRNVCEQVRCTNRDPHLLFAQVGERLGLLPESTVAAAFASMWAQHYENAVHDLLVPIRHALHCADVQRTETTPTAPEP